MLQVDNACGQSARSGSAEPARWLVSTALASGVLAAAFVGGASAANAGPISHFTSNTLIDFGPKPNAQAGRHDDAPEGQGSQRWSNGGAVTPVWLAGRSARTLKVSPLSATAPVTTALAANIFATASPAAASGAYRMADGSSTADLEVAAASWRDDAGFSADPAKAQMHAQYAYALGLTGKGIKIGELDSGVDDLQTAFSGRLHLLSTRDAIDFPDPAFPREIGDYDGRPLVGRSGESFHGTHVAGIIAAAHDGVGSMGVAYGGELYSATHYLANDGFVTTRGGQFEAGVPGIDALVAQGVRVINNSWGSSTTLGDMPVGPRDDMQELKVMLTQFYDGEYAIYRDAFRNAAAHDTVLVFAAGNASHGVVRTTASPQSLAPLVLTDLEPHFLTVTSVGATNKISDFASECGQARFWCLAAPGENIASTGALKDFSRGGTAQLLRDIGLDIADPDLDTKVRDLLAPALSKFTSTGDTSGLATFAYASQSTITLPFPPDVFRDVYGSQFDLMISDSDVLDQQVTSSFKFLFKFVGLLYPDLNPHAEADYAAAILALFDKYGQIDRGTYLESGTSMAAPAATGALGIVMERFSYLTGSQAREVLLTTATDMGAPGVDTTYGWGLIDLQRAVNGPGAFLRDWAVDVTGGVADTWSNNIVNGSIYTGRPEDHGALTKSGSGSLTLSGANSFDGLTVADGTLGVSGQTTLSGDAVVLGGRLDLAATGVLRAATATITGGAFNLSGVLQSTPLRVDGGILSLTGTVGGGDLSVTGGGMAVVESSARLSQSNLVVGAGGSSVMFNGVQTGGTTLVAPGGRLGGVGVLGDTRVEGVIAPGQSIGVLTVNGAYVQAAGSRFEVDLTPPNLSDRLTVNGTARLEGGLVVVKRTAGVYNLGQSYRFLTASGGLTGAFEGVDDTGLSPFLDIGLRYAPTGVTLDVMRGLALVTAARTPNQRATAGAADSLPDPHPVLQSLVQLFPTEAVGAFDQLSGEIHPGVRSALLRQGRYVRNAAAEQAAQGFADDEDGHAIVWAETIGGEGKLNGDGNASPLKSRDQSVLFGAGYQASGLRVGAFFGFGATDYHVSARRSEAKADATYVGLYAGKQWGAIGLRAGAAISDYDLKTQRVVEFPGLRQTLFGQYDVQNHQTFVEGAYAWRSSRGGIEPFLRYARIRLAGDGFTETGGDAALGFSDRTTDTDLVSLGARFDVGVPVSAWDRVSIRLRGRIAEQLASGDRQPRTLASFDAGNPFIVEGAPIAGKSTDIQVGVVIGLASGIKVEAAYGGVVSDHGDDHGLQAKVSVRF
jgi:autotransporter-associated beta strand protein